MKITNVTAYGIFAGSALPSLGRIEECLTTHAFVPCGPSQVSSVGFVPPRAAGGAMVEAIDGQWLMKLAIETRSVPASTLRREVEKRVADIEKQTGRKPGKKERKDLKEDVLLELLPRAFTKLAHVNAWINPHAKTLVLDTPSASRADDVASTLVQAIDGMTLMGINTKIDPAPAMASWLADGEAPEGFAIDRDCELKATDESRAIVRYVNHPLDTEEVKQHISDGKRPTKLAMTWDDRVSFVLTDSGALRSLAYLDGTMEVAGSKEEKADAFDADAALCTGELSKLMAAMTEALGGFAQMEIGQGADQTRAAAE